MLRKKKHHAIFAFSGKSVMAEIAYKDLEGTTHQQKHMDLE